MNTHTILLQMQEIIIDGIKNGQQWPKILACLNDTLVLSTDDQKALFDLSFRHSLSLLLDDNEDELIKGLIDISFTASDQEICEGTLPLTLLEEWADSLPVWKLNVVIEQLEAFQLHFQRDISSGKGRGLVLLRICNEILRRLSKSQNCSLSGRLLLLISKVFPSSERSGVNLRGDLNVDNVTTTTSPNDSSHAEFYHSFWQLQFFFYHPVQALMTENWHKVKSSLEESLTIFKDTRSLGTGNQAQTANDFTNNYPKYLSDPSLLNLQLSDPVWRISILLQFIIFSQHLLSYSSNEELKPPSAKGLKVSLLTAEQERWIVEFMTGVKEHLSSGIYDNRISKVIEWILTCERNWMSWKYHSCPPFGSDAVAPFYIPKEYSQNLAMNDPCISASDIGSKELNRLWRADLLMTGLQERAKPPSHLELLRPLHEQMVDTMDDNDHSLWYSRDESFRWKFLRLLLSDPNIFSNESIGDVSSASGIEIYCNSNHSRQ